jgi:hypothetical protein
MIYESDRNMPLSTVRDSYEWENQLNKQEQACRAIEMLNPALMLSAIREGADIHHPVRPLLVEAARRDKYTAVGHLLDLGADANFADKNGMTAMAGAAKCGNSAVIELLHKSGAVIDPIDRWGTTPLMEAAFHGHLNSANVLVDRGANVNSKNTEGMSVIAYVRHGRAAWERLRTRSHRDWRDLWSRFRLDPEEIQEHYDEDFACVQALDQLYQEIGNYLLEKGAVDCKTAIPFFSFPKEEEKTMAVAA